MGLSAIRHTLCVIILVMEEPTGTSEHELLEAYREQGYVISRQETPLQSVQYFLSENNKRILVTEAEKNGKLKVILGTDVSTERFAQLTQEFFSRTGDQVPDYPFDAFETKDFTSLPSSDSSTNFMYWPDQEFSGKPSKIEVSIPNEKLTNKDSEVGIHLGGFIEGATKTIPRDLIRIMVQHTVDTGARLSPAPNA